MRKTFALLTFLSFTGSLIAMESFGILPQTNNEGRFKYNRLKNKFQCVECLRYLSRKELDYKHRCSTAQRDIDDIATEAFESLGLLVLNRYFVSFGEDTVVCKTCNKRIKKNAQQMRVHLDEKHDIRSGTNNQ